MYTACHDGTVDAHAYPSTVVARLLPHFGMCSHRTGGRDAFRGGAAHAAAPQRSHAGCASSPIELRK